MINFFDAQTHQNFLERIQNLTPGHTAQWGKMTVEQMVQHCIKPLQLALGEVKIETPKIGYKVVRFLFSPIAKWDLTRNDKPMGKNLPTNPEFIITDHPALESAKDLLLSEVKRLFHAGLQSTENKIHPFFGKMTAKQWSILIAKHLDHHLRQFGN